MSKKEVKCDGRIEFDVLVDGKYQRRVNTGILFEAKPNGCEVAMCCGTTNVFDALIALEEFVEEHDLTKPYGMYKKLRSIKSDDIDGTLKALNEVVEMLK